jgi:Fic family protein
LGYDYVKRNDITEENIYELYKILSKNSLEENEKLKSNNYYRHDDVNIVNSVRIVVDRGVDHALIPKLIKDLIDYIHKDKTYEEHLIASHVIHYYLVFLHPYFDFNGRMARVLSFWYNYKYVRTLSLLLVSEAINNNVYKNGYYNAIANSKQMENDITYFLEFMGSIILKYSKVYINFYSILEKLKGAEFF